MSKDIKQRTKDFLKNKLREMSTDEIQKNQEQQHESNLVEFKEFQTKFKDNKCYICDKDLSDFDESTPCIHWVLRQNKKINKKHILMSLSESGIIRAQAYMRWVANEETPLTNINDLKDEVKNSDYLNCTVKFKNLEWTVWCTEQDFNGHQGSNSDFPHWHLQMQIDDNRFISFNNFHIPLIEYDIFTFTMIHESEGKIKHSFFGGTSTQDIFDQFSPDEIMNNLQGGHDRDPSKAPFRISTMVTANEGELIQGDDIADAMEEAKKTGEPWSAILKRKLSNANVTSVVSPSDNIPEFKERSGRKKKNE